MQRFATGAILLSLLAFGPVLAGPTECLYDIEAEGEAGRTVLRTVGYALHRAGLLAAPLHDLQQGGRRWSSLRLVSPGDRNTPRTSFPIESVLLTDAERNLAILRVALLPACGAGIGVLPARGDTVSLLRKSRGYGSPLLETTVERPVTMPGGVAVMPVALDDGSGAAAGFLLDHAGRLLGTILPATADMDRYLVAAVDLSDEAIAAAEEASGIPPAMIHNAGRAAVDDTATVLLAAALVIDRRAPPGMVLDRLAAVEERTGEFTGLLLARGAAEFDLGDLDSAIADFSAAVAADPDEHLAHYNLGISLGADRRYDEAAEAFRSALLLEPDDPHTLYHLAVALAAADRPTEAVEPYTELSRVDPALAADLKALIGL